MSVKEVWDKELQDWVYDDPDCEGETILRGSDKPMKKYSKKALGRTSLPLHLLEGGFHEKKETKS